MNRKQALKILGFKPIDSPNKKQIKKAFKKKAVKLHPDVNKSENADQEFKDLNAAQEFLNNPPKQAPNFTGGPPTTGSGFTDFVNFAQGFGFGFNKSHARRSNVSPHIQTKIKLTFKESIIGCEKNIEVDRFDMCQDCHGKGRFQKHDPCTPCGGKGGRAHRRGNTVHRMVCNECGGSGKAFDDCASCKGAGTSKVKNSIGIKLPGGLSSGKTIPLRGAGNFVPGMGNNRGSIIILVDVEPDPDMTLDGDDVISTIELSLYEALKGVTKKAKTVKGETKLIIAAGSRNKDEISLAGYGVGSKGKHIFILDVKYPEDISKIIDVLKEKVKE